MAYIARGACLVTALFCGLVPSKGLAQMSGPLALARAERASDTRPVRIAVLNLGPPKEWKDGVEGWIGVTISPETLVEAARILREEQVDVVVLRTNCGGEMTSPYGRVQEALLREFGPRFRTVAWIDSALVAGAMSVIAISEWCFASNGILGWTTCVEWGGTECNQRKPGDFERAVDDLVAVAKASHRDPKVARTLLGYEPLSFDVNPNNGCSTLRQDEGGDLILNRSGNIFTVTATLAHAADISIGTADTREELAHVLRIRNPEWVDSRANAMLLADLRKRQASLRAIQSASLEYAESLRMANVLTAPDLHKSYIEKTQRHFARLRSLYEVDPDIAIGQGICKSWIDRQPSVIEQAQNARTK